MQQVNPHRATGTCLQGYLDASYEQIVQAFGEPNCGASGDGKVKAQWVLADVACIVTIYDYKSPVAPEQNRDWHIGGNSQQAIAAVGVHFPSGTRAAH